MWKFAFLCCLCLFRSVLWPAPHNARSQSLLPWVNLTLSGNEAGTGGGRGKIIVPHDVKYGAYGRDSKERKEGTYRVQSPRCTGLVILGLEECQDVCIILFGVSEERFPELQDFKECPSTL